MDFNRIKTPLSCLVGSIVLMSLIYSVFFGVEAIKEAFSASMVFLGVISWKPIFFIFGCSILFLQCMIFNNAKGKYKLYLMITLVLLVLFSIFCAIANYDSFSWKAVFSSVFIMAISQLVIVFKNTPVEKKEDRFLLLAVITGFVCLLFITLFVEPKRRDSEVEQSVKVETEIKKMSYVEEVLAKHHPKFKEMGFTRMDIPDSRYTNDLAVYKTNNFEISKNELFIDNDEAIKIMDKDLPQINFKNVTFTSDDESLSFYGLQYDEKLISQETLAKNLDKVIEKLVIPKLREIKKEIDLQKNNVDSYKK